MGMNEELEKAIEAYDASNYPTTIDELISLAREGDAEAQTNLAMRYALGKNVTQDYRCAYIWATFAADQKNKDALKLCAQVKSSLRQEQCAEISYKLGLMYLEGKEIKQDYQLAFKWFAITCSKTMMRRKEHENAKANREWYEKAKKYCLEIKKCITAPQLEEAREMVQDYRNPQRKKGAKPNPTRQ